MDMDALSSVKFGDKDSLDGFLFENAMQHRLFEQTIMGLGYELPVFPLFDADTANLDDWRFVHQVSHQSIAGLLLLENPFNLLDADFNIQEQFDDFLASHLYIHEQIAATLGLS